MIESQKLEIQEILANNKNLSNIIENLREALKSTLNESKVRF